MLFNVVVIEVKAEKRIDQRRETDKERSRGRMCAHNGNRYYQGHDICVGSLLKLAVYPHLESNKRARILMLNMDRSAARDR